MLLCLARVAFLLLCTGVLISGAASSYAQSAAEPSVILRPIVTTGGEKDINFIFPKGKSFALVIGNNTYKDWGDAKSNWGNLKNAIPDAELVARTLEKDHDFEVELKRNLGYDELREAIFSFFKRHGSDPQSRLILWYAGHGTSLRANNQVHGYLVPVDAPPRGATNLQLKTVDVGDIRLWLRQHVVGGHVLVVFDSCFAGAIVESSGPMRGSFAATRQSLPPDRWGNSVRQFIASGTAEQEVFDDGVFARIFVEAISGRGRTRLAHAPYLTGYELGNYLHDEIRANRPDEQRPVHRKAWHGSYEQDGEFVLRLPGTTPGKPAPAEEATSLPTQAERCLYSKPHFDARAVAREIAALANPLTNNVVHRFEPLQIEPSTGSIVLPDPTPVDTVTPTDGHVFIRYGENGHMVLIPVDIANQGAPDEPGTYLLRGAWRRAGGYGCVEFTLNVNTRLGQGKVWHGLRAAWREGLPYIAKPHLRSSLVIQPR